MKVIIEHVGKVSKAKIDLSGITVIVGPNKSGKSTIGRALMTYGTLLRRMDELVRNRKLRQFLERVGEFLGFSEYFRHRFYRYGINDYQADDILSPDFWKDKNNVSSLLTKLLRTMPSSRAKAISEDMENFDYGRVVEILDEVLGQDDGIMMYDIIEERFRDVFVEQINSLCCPETTAKISLSRISSETDELSVVFKSNRILRDGVIPSITVPKIIYLEPMHLMDCVAIGAAGWFSSNRYGAGDCSWDNIMSPSNDVRENVSLADKQEVLLLLEEIKAILGGELDIRDGRFQFKEKSFPEQTSWVELENLASGMKSMTIILRALGSYSLRKGMIFVIDEPESNLHPEWQIKFALVLVHLWTRLKVRIVVATHSPYFLKGLEMCSAEMNVRDEMSCYFMVSDNEGRGMVAKDVSGHLNDVYKTFFDPLNNLMAGNVGVQ